MAKTMIVGANPLYEKLKELGWKYKEHEQTEKQGRQLAGWGWKRYNMIDGKIEEDPNGIWAKDPEEVEEADEKAVRFKRFEPFQQHCRGGGSVIEQDGRFFNGKHEELKDFNLKEWLR